jgi:hypothetical protein
VSNSDAYLLRENTGTSGLEQTARRAALALAEHEIPHLIIGGLAVQEHGYPRVTIDVDIVVPDVLEAAEFLTADISGPLQRVPNFSDRIKDTRNGVLIDLLPAGKVIKRGCQVPFPQPKTTSSEPQFVGLEDLISLKLDSSLHSPLHRLRDKTDVVELITRRKLPRDLAVAPAVQPAYLELWDGLRSEK